MTIEELIAWKAENPRDALGQAAFAAWVNVSPDNLPQAMRFHTCPATKEAWERVAAAIRAEALSEALDAERERAEAAEAKLAKAVEALGQSRLAFAGYVSPQSAIYMLDNVLSELKGDPKC